MEMHVKKNEALNIPLPMIDSASPENLKTGLSPTDTAYYKDGAGSWTSLSITDTFSEIGSDGLYEIDLTAPEMNHDQIIIKVTAAGAADSVISIRMYTKDIDSLNDLSAAQVNAEVDVALVDYDGPTNTEMVARTLPSADYFDPVNDTVVDVTNTATVTDSTAQTGNSYPVVTNATYGLEELSRISNNIAAFVKHMEGPSWPLATPYYWDPDAGNDSNDGLTKLTPKLTFAATLALCTAYNHDSVNLINTTGAPLSIDIKVDVNVPTTHLIGDGFTNIKPTSIGASTVILSAIGAHIEGLHIETHTTGNEDAVEVTTDECEVHNIHVHQSRGSAIVLNGANDCLVHDILLRSPGSGGNGHGIKITGDSSGNRIHDFDILGAAGSGILFDGANVTENTIAAGNGTSIIHLCGAFGFKEQGGAHTNEIVGPALLLERNASGPYLVSDTTTVENVGPYATIAVDYGGGVWIDSGASNTNTVFGVDGLPSNPVSTLTAARTLADAFGVQKYYIFNSSTLTLAATHNSWEFVGLDRASILSLGGQNVDNSVFTNLSLTGTQGGSTYIKIVKCCLTALLALRPWAYECIMAGNFTLLASQMVIFDHCSSGVAGNLTPEITFSAGVTNVNIRHNSGGTKFINMTSDHTVSQEGDGQIIVDASCVGGHITARGNLTITDNGANMDITQDAVYNTTNVRDAMKLAPTAGSPAAGSVDKHLDDIEADTTKIGTIPALDGASATIGGAIAKLADDNAGASFDAETDSQRAIGAKSSPTAEEIAGTTWDKPLSEHTTPGSAGAKLESASTGGNLQDLDMEGV